ncbi:MAG: DUF1810 domain-containing protein [Vicinamibacterales bacterium]
MADPYNLARFVEAQAMTYDRALRELRQGAKTSHWMWFIFPQVAGLGSSEMSRRYAISSSAEAAAYLAHPILGPRLRECAVALLAHAHRSAREILGEPDDAKLRSSATLFAKVEGDGPFAQVLAHFFAGARDEATIQLLRAADGSG